MVGAVDLPDPREADGAGRVDLARTLAAPVPDDASVRQGWEPASSTPARSPARCATTTSTRPVGPSGPVAAGPAGAGPAAAGLERRGSTARRLTRVTLGALIAATAVAAIVLWHQVVRDLVPYGSEARIPWWALAAGFAATELFVIHAHVRGSAHSLSLSELPLVLGLLLASPNDLVLAMVVGPAVVLIFTRGQSVERLLFNLAQFGLTAALASITLHALAPAPAVIGPAVWGATFVAVLVSSGVAAVLVFCAIGLSEGRIPSRKLAGMLGADLLVALTNTSVALAGATVVAHDLTAGWLLLPPAVILLLAYKAWVSERAKHQSLEFLYGVTRSLSSGGELEPELLDLLRRTRSSFRVKAAELVVLPGSEVGALRTARGSGGARGGHGAGRQCGRGARCGRRSSRAARCGSSATSASRSCRGTWRSAASSRH